MLKRSHALWTRIPFHFDLVLSRQAIADSLATRPGHPSRRTLQLLSNPSRLYPGEIRRRLCEGCFAGGGPLEDCITLESEDLNQACTNCHWGGQGSKYSLHEFVALSHDRCGQPSQVPVGLCKTHFFLVESLGEACNWPQGRCPNKHEMPVDEDQRQHIRFWAFC